MHFQQGTENIQIARDCYKKCEILSLQLPTASSPMHCAKRLCLVRVCSVRAHGDEKSLFLC